MNMKIITDGAFVDKRLCLKERGETWLSRLAVSVLVIYIISSPFPLIVGSLQYGDLWLAVAALLALLSGKALNSLVRFFRSGYFLLSLYTFTAMLTATFNAPSFFENLKSIAQLMVVMWILIPLVAVGLAQMRTPLRFLEVGAWLYIITFTVGAVLQFGFGLSWILFNTGINRFFMSVDFGAFGASALCLSAAYLFVTRPFRRRYLLLLIGSILPAIFAASRADMLAIVVVIATAILISRRSWYNLTVALIVMVLVATLLFTNILQCGLGILDRSAEFFEDSQRVKAVSATWQSWSSSPATLLFGVGWGESGVILSESDSRIVAHNLPLQVLGQAGILTAVGLLAMLALPLFWWFKYKQALSMERTFVLLLFVAIFIGWLLHPISYLRISWLPFAVLMGVAYRLRIKHQFRGRTTTTPTLSSMSSTS